MQTQLYLGIAFDELFDRGRQRVARLGVGSGDGEVTTILRMIFLGDLFEIFSIVQHALGNGQHSFAGLGDGHNALAIAYEYFDA